MKTIESFAKQVGVVVNEQNEQKRESDRIPASALGGISQKLNTSRMSVSAKTSRMGIKEFCEASGLHENVNYYWRRSRSEHPFTLRFQPADFDPYFYPYDDVKSQN
jgi:hypothetical protein